jgi:UDP-N-acetylmuramoyl-tripeptide--D-alanyl-D-alanine ligase
MTLPDIGEGLTGGWSAPHRVGLVRLPGVTIIDDSYNASPGSMRAALEVLADLTGRHVAVLGEMLELGSAHDDGHFEVGQAAGRVADLVIVVGRGAEAMAEGARATAGPGVRVLAVGDESEALDALRPRLRDGDVVLVKGSRGIGLDHLVDALKDERA